VGLLALPIVGGSVAFFLFFSGLAAAGGPGAAFIHKTLFVWVAILAVPLLGESVGWPQVVALGALLVGSMLLTPPDGLVLGGGEVLLFGATLLWAVEVVIARRLLPGVSVRLAATARMALGAAIMVGLLAIGGRLDGLLALTAWQWLLIVVTGALLFGYVATWFGALQRAPATVVTSVLVIGAVVTGLLGAAWRGALPAAPQSVGLVVIAAAAGAFALYALRRRGEPAEVGVERAS
jgi:drug/metabolite transporter (DMT)-like permease